MNKFEVTLRLFKSILVTDIENVSKIPNEKALKYGVFISSSFFDDVVEEAIKQYGRNGEEANQTFHKSLFKVANADIEQLYYEQLLHYFTTYGAEELGVYDSDNVIIPKEKLEVPELQDDTKLVVIKPITEDELRERIKSMITVNLALSKQTVRDIVELSDYINRDEYSEGDNYFCKIKNKEVKSALCGKLGILPKRGDEFLRYFLAKLCDRTLLIKDKETIRAISLVETKDELELLNRYKEQYGLIPLAKVFNRFKKLFIAMKRQEKELIRYYYKKEDIREIKEVNKIINTISKLSKKYHEPMPSNDLNQFIKWLNSLGIQEEEIYRKAIEDKLSDAGIYTTIKIANYLEHVYNSELNYNLYKVRNGRIYIKDGVEKPYLPMFNVLIVKQIVRDYLKNAINNKTVYIPYNIDYKLPQSEKQFIGNIPFGSKISLNKQSLLVGIHWCNVENNRGYESRVDLDLHLNSNKYDLGWHSGYRDDDCLTLFTGDNTNAPLPLGASEFMYIDEKVEDTVFSLKINNYTRDVGPIPYEIIIGKADKDKAKSMGRDFIIDPNDIIAKIPMEMELGKAEQIIGIVDIDGENINLIFTDLTTSDRSVSGNKDFERKVRNFIKEQSLTQLSLYTMLRDAGAVMTDEPTMTIDVPYVLDENLKLIKQEEADEKGISYTGDELYFKKEEVPVDIDFSLDALTKDSFINLLNSGIKGE